MTIRFRLTTMAVAAVLVANSLLSFITFEYLSHVWLKEVQTRVHRNLNRARTAYERHLALMAALLKGKSLDRTLAGAVRRNDRRGLEVTLYELGEAGSLDFVVILDPAGKVICRTGSRKAGDDLRGDPLVARAMSGLQTVTGTVSLSRERLQAEGSDLAERARLEVVPTPAARVSPDRVRTEGMVVAAAAPVLDENRRVAAILYGGILLNRRYDIVDAIKQEELLKEVYRGKDIGTVTIFHGDLRIATNVTMEDGSRAIGTQLSAAVCEEVLDRGGTWAAAPALMIDDWYIASCEPIRDPDHQIIGALSVGFLQSPFLHQRDVAFAVFLTIVVVAASASVILLFAAQEMVLRPIRHVVAMVQKVIGGDLTARVGIRPAGEMGALCQAIDSMAQAVAEREDRLEGATRQQVGRSEQLASVGRLAAGVAHEINNPLTGVLAFADLLREKENMDEQDRQDLELIIRETKRAREIVRGLLDFARETPSMKTRLNVNDVIRQTLKLLGKREAFQSIIIVEDLADELPPIDGDRNQLEQVFVNLSLNACEAMSNGGTLLMSTTCEDGSVVVKVTDTGCGIKAEHVDQIFEPFFTTKPVGKGTGLGLSVSYGIVHQHGGTLEVESEEGEGTTFTVRLPCEERGREGEGERGRRGEDGKEPSRHG
jgi:two-component system NtrC family sensor kinase